MTAKSDSVQIVATPFAGGPRQLCDCVVDSQGVVRVYDSVAGYYTVCHSLTELDMAKVRALWRGGRK